ncbi:MAG: beta-N-acetylhexosaminidase [Clostridia bacterium]|nr:beta-N-acetylhexosaminidase [Clostridia bacterium]
MVNINDLTLEEKLGQMMMVGFNGNKINDRVKDLVLKYKVGGFILYKKNFDSYEQMLQIIRELKEINSTNKIPLFIAIDQEGGRVNRMPQEIKNLPSAYNMAQTGNLDLIKEAAKITGEMLYNSGINMNFAPVLDIKRFKNKHAIGDRCYSDNKDDVIKYGLETMKEITNNKVISVIKHFPGHGLTSKDTHFFLPVVKKSMDEIEKEDILPFKKAIEQGADAIMVGHIIINAMSKTLPASLSRKFIGKYIRKKLKFNGLVITDDLKMRAIRFVYGYKLAVRQAFTSGSDIIMFRFDHKDEKNAILQAYRMAKYGLIKEGRVNTSVKRILKVKEKYAISDTCEFNGINVDEINERIQRIRDKV